MLTSGAGFVIDRVMKNYLGTVEFAGIVGKDRSTVERWIKKGLVPGVRKVGRTYRIPISEVENYKKSPEYPWLK